jgi:outer membrane protein assembly factor BamB
MHSRRQWLGAALALGLESVLAPLAQATSASASADRLVLRQRWTTGNRHLAPTSDLDGHILFAGERQLGLLDPAQPQAVWSTSHALTSAATFRPRGNQHGIVCGGQAEITGWRLGETSARWRYRARDQIGTPCLAGNTVYFGDGHELLAVNVENGEILWRFATTVDTRISYAPVVAGDSVLLGPGDGRLIALSASDGQPRWMVDRMADWQYLRQLQVSGDTLIAGGYKEKLHGIEIASGRQRWEFSAGNFINSHHVANGVAYLWSPTGWLYAIDAESGRQRWRHRTNDYRGGIHNWGAMLAELSSDETRLYALDLHNVLHVLAIDDGRSLLDFKLPERVRPFVMPVPGQGLILGNYSGQILLFSLPAQAIR